MSDVRPTKVIRIIARLNVGGPAKHVAVTACPHRRAASTDSENASRVKTGVPEEPVPTEPPG